MEAEEIQAQVEAGVDAATLPVGSSSSGMTLRERWRRTMFFQKVDSELRIWILGIHAAPLA